ncbi:autotransporter outer membrane beta-barrel domain-containing protein [Eoetvoesiella caeni]|uniref:Outer membrane autotransporter protein n=1 Tax=Eoetvoesiella caeni TaxID=645616 RepID=A0A366HHQ6_9BURK|nr:autotransporter domain-containing protein [Eoetvoesiella caeni]MCI2807756.1 autotransporter domain-containing protein [Eoetvoesiella caeni]NYT54239.1 autotransporter domain-containing protein [Eoetvoesiella caeni]RBP41671.1 outer membrane autotransporter protein [Eoetvoesiella caeni]
MMIQELSMLPLVGNSRLDARSFEVIKGLRKGLVHAAGALLLALGVNSGAAALETAGPMQDQRRYGPLFEGLAEPPPLAGMQAGKALMGQPLAPFVFSGVMRIADPGFESADDYLIGASAATINVGEGAAAHFSGHIGSMPGSPHGLIKLGAGELALSGLNTYAGNSRLLQGGLQARSNNAWGWASLLAAPGTRLEYAPGVQMDASLHITAMRVQDWAPPGSYDEVPAPPHADSLRWVVEEGQAFHAGLLQGDAPFVKQGAGRLNIVGDAMPYMGNALVEAGTLAINEIFGGFVVVGKGARLEGNGTVAGARILRGGALAPGNSIGTLMVVGDVYFEPGSRFEVEVDPGGAGDALRVGGKASLAGDVVALARAGVWKPSTSYALLSADQGLDGRFDSVSVPGDFAFLQPQLAYDAQTVTLTLVRNETPLDDVAQTPDEDEVAQAIDKENSSPGLPILRDEVLVLDRTAARDALQQLSGSWTASAWSSMLEDSRFVRHAALEHAQRQGFWSRAFYSEAERGAADGVPGDTRSLHGMVLGVNRRLGQEWQAGVFLGVQHSRLRREGDGIAAGGSGPASNGAGLHGLGQADNGGVASATVQSTHLGVIAAGQWRPLRLAAGAVHTRHAVKSARHVAFGALDESLSSRYQAHGTQIFAEAAWPVWLHNVHPPSAGSGDGMYSDQGGPRGRPASFLLEPFVRIAYVHLNVPGFDEQGGAAALSVQSARQSVLFSSLGMRAEHTFETEIGAARLQGQLAWRHAAGTRAPASSQRFAGGTGQHTFTSHGLPIARSAWSLDLSVTGQLSKQASLSLAYAGQLSKGTRDHGVQLSLRWAF